MNLLFAALALFVMNDAQEASVARPEFQLSIRYLAVSTSFFDRIGIDLQGKTVISDIEAYFLVKAPRHEVTRNNPLFVREAKWIRVEFTRHVPPGSVRPFVYLCLQRSPNLPGQTLVTILPGDSSIDVAGQSRHYVIDRQQVIMYPLLAEPDHTGILLIAAGE